MIGSLGLWVRSEWRHGWRALIGLTVLVAIGGGITLTAFAGARRADTAFDRFLSAVSGPLDLSAAGIQTDLTTMDDAWSTLTPKIAAVQGVDGVTPVSWMAVAFALDGGLSEFFSIATGPVAGPSPPPGARVIDGRAAVAPDEVMINEEAERVTGLTVGDRLPLHSYAPDQVGSFFGSDLEDPRGPLFDAEIVGIYRSAEDITDNPEPFMLLSPAFHDTYADQIAHCDCSFWIAASPDDLGRVANALDAVVGDRPLAAHEVDSELRSRVERSVNLEVGALMIAAAVGALAAALAIAQAIARQIAAGRGATTVLTAIGATRSELVRSWVLIMAPVAVVGAVGAMVTSILLSPLFPRGLARRAEAHRGIRVDAPVLIGGGIAISVTVLLLAVASAAIVTTSRRVETSRHVHSWVSRLRPTAALGASFAVDPARDRSRIVAVSAIGGLALAISGVVTVALIERSTADVLDTPSAFAADWDIELTAQPDDPDAVIAAIMAEQSIESFALQYGVTGNQFEVTGPTTSGLVSPQTFEAMKGSMGAILDSGRQPEAPDEVVLGPAIADRIGAHVGDELRVDSGPAGIQQFDVSGIGRLSDGDETDRSFVVTPEGLSRLQGPEQLSITGAYVRLGAADDGTRERLERLGFTPARPPSRIATLEQIGIVPRLLAIALAALGLGGVIHGLLVARSRRRVDLAIARALGFAPRQVSATLRWQGVTITAIASLVGVPAGLFVGRVIWKQVAAGVGAVDLVSIPWLVLIFGPILALCAVTAASSIVGWRASRLRPATVLRSE